MKGQPPAGNIFENLKKVIQVHKRQTKYDVTDNHPL